MMEKNGISIVIPCFNQGSILLENIAIIQKYFSASKVPFEIIAVNDGSEDNTHTLVKDIEKQGVRVYSHAKNFGKGRAVQTGVLAARFPLTLFLDADLAIPISEARNFLEAFEENEKLDIAIASRFVPGHKTLVPVLPHRKVLERVFQMLRKLIIGLPAIQDTQCGFKMFRTQQAQAVFKALTCKRFSFDAELLYIAQKWGMNIQEFPVALQNPPQSSISLLRDSIRMFYDLFKIRWKDAFGWYQRPVPAVPNITLDDFGLNHVVTERILQVLSSPRIQRVAVMANKELAPSHVETLLQSEKKIDIHLELPGGAFGTEAHGNFLGRISKFLRAFLRGEFTNKKVQFAFQQQIKKFHSVFGRYPDGINSHEHIHFFPTFYKIVLKIGYQYHIPFLRLGAKSGFPTTIVAFVLFFFRRCNLLFIGKPLTTSRALFSYDWGVHPREEGDVKNEILYHVERDEEWVYFS